MESKNKVSNLWKEITQIPKAKPKKQRYYTRKECEKKAEKYGYKIFWDCICDTHKVVPTHVIKDKDNWHWDGDNFDNTNQVMNHILENKN
jgi:hypothetical protein